MRIEAEVRIKTNTEDARRLSEGNWNIVYKDLRMRLRLASLVRSEQGDGALLWSNRQHLTLRPRNNSIKISLETRFQFADVDSGTREREIIRIGWLLHWAIRDEEIEQEGPQDGPLGHPCLDIAPRGRNSLPSNT